MSSVCGTAANKSSGTSLKFRCALRLLFEAETEPSSETEGSIRSGASQTFVHCTTSYLPSAAGSLPTQIAILPQVIMGLMDILMSALVSVREIGVLFRHNLDNAIAPPSEAMKTAFFFCWLLRER